MIEIAGALAAFKAVKDLGQVIYSAQVDAATKDKVRNVLQEMDTAQATLYALRDELFTLQSENAALKQQIAEGDEWKAQLAKYSLVKTGGGAVVYQFSGQLEHFACPNCIGAKRITPLQDNRTMSGKYRCTHPACNGAEFPIELARTAPLSARPSGQPDGWMGR